MAIVKMHQASDGKVFPVEKFAEYSAYESGLLLSSPLEELLLQQLDVKTADMVRDFVLGHVDELRTLLNNAVVGKRKRKPKVEKAPETPPVENSEAPASAASDDQLPETPKQEGEANTAGGDPAAGDFALPGA